MSINPLAPTPQGLSAALSGNYVDLERRIRNLEARRGASIGEGSLDGGVLQPGSVPGSVLVANSITTALLAANAVTTATLAAGAVTTAILDAQAVTTDKLAANAVTSDKIAANAVVAGKISVADLSAVSSSMGTLTAGRIRIGNVGEPRLELGQNIGAVGSLFNGLALVDSSGAITLKADAATGNLQIKGQIQTGSTGLGNFADNLPGGSIVDNTITGAKLVVDAITAREIAASTITTLELAANAVTATNVSAGAITTEKLAFGQRQLLKNSTFAHYSGTAFDSWLPFKNSGSGDPIITPNTSGGPLNPPTCVKIEPNGASGSGTRRVGIKQTIVVEPSKQYSFSVYNFCSDATGVSVVIQVDYKDSGGTIVKTDNWTVPASTGAWARVGSGTTPSTSHASARTADVTFQLAGAGVDNTDDYFLANPQVEQQSRVGPWTAQVDVTFIDGQSITSAMIRTSTQFPRLQIDPLGGYQVYDATGTLTAQMLPGVGGLDLTVSIAESVDDYPPDRLVRFVRENDTVVGQLGAGISFGAGDPATSPEASANMESLVQHVSQAVNLLSAKTEDDWARASFQVFTATSGPTTRISSLGGSANGRTSGGLPRAQDVTIINDRGESSFMAFGNSIGFGNPDVGKIRFNMGRQDAVWNPDSTYETFVPIAHNLGGYPTIFCTIDWTYTNFGRIFYVGLASYDTLNQATVKFETADGSTRSGTFRVHWFAILKY